MAKRAKPWQWVLTYDLKEKSRGAVRRAYTQWRANQGLPECCDIRECRFHTEALVWNNQPLRVTLDHKDGCRLNNRPDNLRLLCPNCASQLPTNGGGNKGRVRSRHNSGYIIQERDGRTAAYQFGCGGLSCGGEADFGPAAPSTP